MGRGGRRTGAGRPPKEPGDKKVSVTICVPPRTRDIIRKLRDDGVNVNVMIEYLIDGLQ